MAPLVIKDTKGVEWTRSLAVVGHVISRTAVLFVGTDGSVIRSNKSFTKGRVLEGQAAANALAIIRQLVG